MPRFDDQIADDSGKAVFTLGSITFSDKKINQIVIIFVCGAFGQYFEFFCCDISTGSKDTVP